MRGRDIKRYSYEFANIYLINTHNGYIDSHGNQVDRVDVNNYPAIKRHLDKYWDKIEKRYDQGETPYNLRNCAYMEDFNKQKIVYQELTQGSSFAMDANATYFVSNTGYILTGDHLNYLLVMLNSKCIEFSFRKFYSISIGVNGLRWLAQFIEKLPIPLPSKESSITNLSDEDIYNIYKFTNEEIDFIESQ